jgi:hypothetical protein
VFGRKFKVYRLLLFNADIGQAHSVCGKHTGQRVEPDRSDAQNVSDLTGMLASCAAEAAKCEIANVFPTLYRDLANRIRHVLDSDRQEAGSDGLRTCMNTAVAGNLRRQFIKLR